MRFPGESEPSGIESERDAIEKELRDLEFEAIPENIEAVKELRSTPNIPGGFGEIEANLDNPRQLQAEMEKAGITSITHSEGKTVWDHTRLCCEKIRQTAIPAEIKSDLALILLYHDLGKTEAIKYPWNRGKTSERIKQGKLQLAMMGHTEARVDDIRRSLQANGLTDCRLNRAMIVIQNHMRTDLLIMNPVKIVPIIESFGTDDAQRRETLDLLALTIQIDGLGTQYTRLAEGRLTETHDTEKERFDPATVWKRYEEGKILTEKAKADELQRQKRNEQEMDIFGASLFDYLVQRGIEKGPNMGRIMKLVRARIDELTDTDPAAIKIAIDGLELQ